MSVPFTIALDGAQSGISGSPNLATTPKSPWRDLNCKGSKSLDTAARLMCEAFSMVGRVLGTTQYRYKLAPDRRSVLVTSQNGGGREAAFSIDADIGYEVEVHNRVAHRSCGDPRYQQNPTTRKNDYLHFHLHEEARLTPTSDFKLQATFAHTLRPDAPCRIDIFPPAASDVTAAITAVEESEVTRSEEHLSAQLAPASLQLRAAADAAWRRMQAPYPIPASGLYLRIHPKRVSILPLQTVGNGDHLSIKGTFQIEVAPEITTQGDREAAVPLPPLEQSAEARRGAGTIDVMAVMPYAYVSKMLNKRFAGERVRYGLLPAVTVRDVAVYPTTSGAAPAMAVKVTYSGPFSGALYAWGTPLYDVTSKSIAVPNLNVSPDTNGLLSRAIRPWLRRPSFERKLRSKANVNVSRQLEALNALMSRPYHEQLQQVVVDARLGTLRITRAEIARGGIAVHLNVNLSSSVEAAFDIAPLFEKRFNMAIR